MKVYILFQGVDYEYEKVVGVFGSHESALTVLKNRIDDEDYREDGSSNWYLWSKWPHINNGKPFKDHEYLRIQEEDVQSVLHFEPM